ncbi:MAG: SoxR reducing system RseC family protein [Pseudomonadota bacterium]
MMTERARVVALEGEIAIVEVSVKSACGSCEHGGGCGVSRLGRLVRPRPARWRMENRAGARVGDEVWLALEDTALTAAAVLAYIPPLFGMLLGGAWLSGTDAGEGVAVLGALAGLALGLLVSRFMSRSARLAPRMLSTNEALAQGGALAPSQPMIFTENKR